MNLNDIMQAAQGGQGVNNLATQFGLSPEQTQAAINAMMPAFSQGLQGAMANPGSLGSILSQMASGAHGGAFTGTTPPGAAPGAGGDVLGSLFGNPQVMGQLTQHMSQMSGVSPQVLQQMMPAVASILMGGLTHNMNNQGFGGMLGQLANAATAPGGLGPMLGGAASQQAGGGLGGMVGSILGSLFGGGQGAPQGQSTAMQAGLNSLTNMLNAGVQVSQAHQQGLQSILQGLASATQQKP